MNLQTIDLIIVDFCSDAVQDLLCSRFAAIGIIIPLLQSFIRYFFSNCHRFVHILGVNVISPVAATTRTFSAAATHHTAVLLIIIVAKGAAFMACLGTILALGVIVVRPIPFAYPFNGIILEWFSRVERGFKCLDLCSFSIFRASLLFEVKFSFIFSCLALSSMDDLSSNYCYVAPSEVASTLHRNSSTNFFMLT